MKIEVVEDAEKERRTEKLQKRLSGKTTLEKRYEQELMRVHGALEEELEDREKGDVNPYTGREYESNTVRVHPDKIGYVEVYSRTIHGWELMTEWALLGREEQKKMTEGDKYEPPIFV